MNTDRSCEIHALEISNLKTELTAIKDKVDELERELHQVENYNTEIRLTFKSYEEKFVAMEETLLSIARDIKGISEAMLVLKTKDKLGKGEVSNTLISKLLQENNRTIFVLIIILGSGLLFSLGMNVGDILKIIKP